MSINKEFMTRGQKQPLPKPCVHPLEIGLIFCQGICYQQICLDLKFQVNMSINKDFMTRGQNQPLPKSYSAPGRNRVNLY